jgi:predicted site-specific integrase-resolvase
MPIEIDGQKYYRTLEVCRKTGISRATLFRWINRGIFSTLLRDRRGWRLFTEGDLNKIKTENGKVEVERMPRAKKPGK